MESSIDKQTLQDILAQMTEALEAVNAANAHLAKLRRDARVMGMDLDAANYLVTMTAKHKADHNLSVVSTLVGYARAVGVEVHGVAIPESGDEEEYQAPKDRLPIQHDPVDSRDHRKRHWLGLFALSAGISFTFLALLT